MRSPVAVVGGGLGGLVVGERLHSAGMEAVVYERELEPGGACRSVSRDGFTFDYTGHLLHVGQQQTETYLEELGVWTELQLHERLSAVVIGGRQTPYPVQIHSHGLAPEVRRDCLLGFIHAWAGRSDGNERNFRDWVLDRFGEGLAKHFFFPYNSKLYRAQPEELSLDWVGRYVPKPDLEQVVDGALGLHRGKVGYNATFRYPIEGGISLLPDRVAALLPDLRLGCEVRRVHLGEGWLQTGDGERRQHRKMVFTGSLPALVDMVCDRLPEKVRAARRALRWVRVMGLCLGVEGPPSSDQHWLYFADPELPFYRVGFPSNHGRLAPTGCHTVTIEVSLDPEGAEVAAVAEQAEQALAECGYLDRSAVLVRQLTVIDPAYVVFDHARRQAVSVLRRYFSDHGVLLCGRWAEWKYSAMEDAILDGMSAARRCAKQH